MDVDYGTQPFVTSSNCALDGLVRGAGLNRTHVDLALGIFKGFYMTRVGEGPFPTELGALDSAKWCGNGKANKWTEVEAYSGVTVNDPDEFRQGIALRMVGDEYGATTGRPRPTGWLDLPLLRHALRWNDSDVVLTKLDILNKCDEIKVCTHHEYFGDDYQLGDMTIKNGDRFSTAIPSSEVLRCCKPVYKIFPGWKKSIRGAKSLHDLPVELLDILMFVSAEAGVGPRIISVGPAAGETIFL